MSGRAAGFAREQLGAYQAAVDRRLTGWLEAGVNGRLWSADPTLWGEDHARVAAHRLGWLQLPSRSLLELDGWRLLREAATDSGVDQILVLGMGGASLGAGMIARLFEQDDGARVQVLDSTHPVSVRRAVEALSRKAWIVVASKSGTTLETRCLADFVVDHLRRHGRRSEDAVLAVTDPGSPLADWAQDVGVRSCLYAPTDVGGRFSALSAFGLLPALLAGADLRPMLENARDRAVGWSAAASDETSPLRLGAALGELARAGRDKLHLVTEASEAWFGNWLEQLIAESLGKRGRGVIPVRHSPARMDEILDDGMVVVFRDSAAGEASAQIAAVSPSAPWMALPRATGEQLGGEILRWEIAVALAALVLEVPPFDQPDVQVSKDWTRRRIEAPETGGETGDVPVLRAAAPTVAADLIDWMAVPPPDYVAIQAFLAAGPEMDGALERLAATLSATLERSVTLGYGPRFLHSTGQLHKGGPVGVACLQLVDDGVEDLPIPGRGYGFRRLHRAQADGDLAAVQERGRRILRLELGRFPATALRELSDRITRIES